MCFSAEADMVAAVVVTGVGIDTVRHVGHDREWALAALPLVFGLHQAVEVPVWWGLDGGVTGGVAHASAWLYLAIAFGLVPWIVPFAVRHLETDLRRRRLMGWLTALGVAVAVALMIPTIIGPISVSDGGNHLAYHVPLVAGGEITFLYVVATCGALLMSSDRVVQIYGALNLVVVATLAILLATGIISLWCVWAAVTSIAIAVHLRRIHRLHSPPPMIPVG